MKVPCNYCGKTLERFPSRVKDNKHQFCDKACYDDWQRKERDGSDTRPCDICGTPVTRPKSQFLSNVACNQECLGKLLSKLKIEHWGTANQRIAICDQCNKEFTRKPNQLKRYGHNFCSRECHYKFMTGRKNPINGAWYPCENCGELVYRTPATLMDHVFCSPKCQRAILPHPCLGKRIPSRAGKNHYNWKGGYDPYYGPSWYSARQQTRIRDNHICQECGKTREEKEREPDVHHIIPFREFGIERHEEANTLSNLVCLCRSCHTLADSTINS